MKYALFFLLIVVALGFGCKDKQNENKLILARVYDTYLYYDEIADIIPDKLSPEDSSEQVMHLVDLWIKKQLMIRKAELNLTAEQKDVSKQLEDYRASLLIHKYKQKFTNQKLDTAITDEEIENYYNTYSLDYQLAAHSVKALFIKVPVDVPNIEQIRRLYKSERTADITRLQDLVFMSAHKFDNFDDKWIYFTQLLSLLPITVENPEVYLRSNRSIEAQDSAFHYFVLIRDFKLKGDNIPLDFLKNDIKTILLNKKKIDMLNVLENELFNDALNHNNAEIFTTINRDEYEN